MVFYARGSTTDSLSSKELRAGLLEALGKLGTCKRVLAVPPDYTRVHSRSGELTRYAWDFFGKSLVDILPALGTHAPVSEKEMSAMFGDVPRQLFRVHDWRKDIVTLGTVPADYVRAQSEGAVDFPWPAQVNRLVAQGGHDLVLSFGQVVPHEVIGMAGYNKNILVGTGGVEGIGKSHFLGAAYGMERIMGRADNPVRRMLNYASENFARHLPIVYVLTVVGKSTGGDRPVLGLFVGDDLECFKMAAKLSLQCNVELVDHPLARVVAYLDPAEFKSTWLGNKAIYRTRMALADGAELIVLAPGVREFGEDKGIDSLIRKHGYCGTQKILSLVKTDKELGASLGAAAHLIHGSSEGRFNVTYCPGHLTKQEVEGVGFRWADLASMLKRYDPSKLVDGFNTVAGGEEIFFISNPALGLWSCREKFEEGRTEKST